MRIRTLTLDDISACLSLARQCDWPTDEARWRLLLEVGNGFGVDAPEGGLAATVIATPFEHRAAWIGMMVVAPAHQRKGLGQRLMEHALGRLGEAIAARRGTGPGARARGRVGAARR
jgi:GNAT superfamily N-acetyltransferase